MAATAPISNHVLENVLKGVNVPQVKYGDETVIATTTHSHEVVHESHHDHHHVDDHEPQEHAPVPKKRISGNSGPNKFVGAEILRPSRSGSRVSTGRLSRHGSKIENGSRHGSQIGHGASRHGSKIGDHEHLVHVEEVKKIEIYTDHDGVKHIDETITTTRRRDSSCSSQSTVKANDDTVSRHSVKSAKSNGGAIGTGAAVAPANGIGQGASVIEHTVHPTDPAQINLDQIFQNIPHTQVNANLRSRASTARSLKAREEELKHQRDLHEHELHQHSLRNQYEAAINSHNKPVIGQAKLTKEEELYLEKELEDLERVSRKSLQMYEETLNGTSINGEYELHHSKAPSGTITPHSHRHSRQSSHASHIYDQVPLRSHHATESHHNGSVRGSVRSLNRSHHGSIRSVNHQAPAVPSHHAPENRNHHASESHRSHHASESHHHHSRTPSDYHVSSGAEDTQSRVLREIGWQVDEPVVEQQQATQVHNYQAPFVGLQHTREWRGSIPKLPTHKEHNVVVGTGHSAKVVNGDNHSVVHRHSVQHDNISLGSHRVTEHVHIPVKTTATVTRPLQSNRSSVRSVKSQQHHHTQQAAPVSVGQAFRQVIASGHNSGHNSQRGSIQHNQGSLLAQLQREQEVTERSGTSLSKSSRPSSRPVSVQGVTVTSGQLVKKTAPASHTSHTSHGSPHVRKIHQEKLHYELCGRHEIKKTKKHLRHVQFVEPKKVQLEDIVVEPYKARINPVRQPIHVQLEEHPENVHTTEHGHVHVEHPVYKHKTDFINYDELSALEKVFLKRRLLEEGAEKNKIVTIHHYGQQHQEDHHEHEHHGHEHQHEHVEHHYEDIHSHHDNHSVHEENHVHRAQAWYDKPQIPAHHEHHHHHEDEHEYDTVYEHHHHGGHGEVEETSIQPVNKILKQFEPTVSHNKRIVVRPDHRVEHVDNHKTANDHHLEQVKEQFGSRFSLNSLCSHHSQQEQVFYEQRDTTCCPLCQLENQRDTDTDSLLSFSTTVYDKFPSRHRGAYETIYSPIRESPIPEHH